MSAPPVARRTPEKDMQMAIVRWANENDVLLVHPGAGAAYLNGAATAATMKAMGLTPGTADLLVLEPGADGAHCLAVELKVPGKTLTPVQTEWHARATAKGLRCGVVHSLEEFVTLLKEHREGHGSGQSSSGPG